MLHQTGADCGHWNMLPVYLARMGMGGEFTENCRGMIEANQGFLNGFNAESGEGGSPGGWPKWYAYTETESKEKRMVKTDDFTHFDFETGPILAMGIEESLLQSHEGVLRVFPAVKPGSEASFILYAQGGFRVGGEITPEGCVVTVTSLRGEDCFVSLPGPENLPEGAVWRQYRLTAGRFEERTVRFTDAGGGAAVSLADLRPGDTVLFSTSPIGELETLEAVISAPNGEMKRCGQVSLGSPRLT
ncbi:MAG: hypothetical protein IIU08_05990 [Clostridia bacterium]|nr:hypothetical protein [Clostridia bacterium]